METSCSRLVLFLLSAFLSTKSIADLRLCFFLSSRRETLLELLEPTPRPSSDFRTSFERAKPRSSVVESSFFADTSFLRSSFFIHSTDPKAFNNRASAYTKLVAFPEALKDANHAITLDPLFVKAHIRKSLVLFGMREYAKAIQACAAATDADVEKKNTKEIEAQLRKCLVETEKEREGESEEQTLKRAMRDPEVAVSQVYASSSSSFEAELT